MRIGFGLKRLTALAIFVLMAGVSGMVVPENARAAQHAWIVISARTGRILTEHNANSPHYPASLTKMMTLYLTFQALKDKRITLDTRFRVSRHAASMQPTKLGLIPGQTVPVRDLILGIVTQSANDAAVVLAEGLAGSEPAFAQRMTRMAHAMGMDRTHFDNASGLPDPRNISTAADLAILARHLYLDFPQYYHYFSVRTFTYHGRTFSTFDHLMERYPGMDGIKTGFIDASGFNLASSAVRDGRRLIGVVLGGQTARSRDNQMAALLNAAFAEHAAPAPQPIFAQRKTKDRTALHALARRAEHTLATLSPIGRAEAATASDRVQRKWVIQVGAYMQHAAAVHAGETARARLPAELHKPLIVVAERARRGAIYKARIIDLTRREAQSACHVLHRAHRDCLEMASASRVIRERVGAASPRETHEKWAIQVGAYMQHAAAVHAGETARARLPAELHKPLIVVAARARKGAIYKARLVDLTRREAQTACHVLHRAHQGCLKMTSSMQFAAADEIKSPAE